MHSKGNGGRMIESPEEEKGFTCPGNSVNVTLFRRECEGSEEVFKGKKRNEAAFAKTR